MPHDHTVVPEATTATHPMDQHHHQHHQSASDPATAPEQFPSIEPEALGKAIFSANPFLLLDVRCLKSFQLRHICNARSVACATMMQRRLVKGKARVADVVLEAERDVFAEQLSTMRVVVYDENSTSSIDPQSCVAIFLAALRREGCEVFYLYGGFAQFFALMADMTEAGCASGSLQLPLPRRGSFVRPLTMEPDPAPIGSPGNHAAPPPTASKPDPNLRMSEVLPYLFVGGSNDAANLELLRMHNIQFIINVTTDCPNYHEHIKGFVYKNIPILDTWHQNIAVHFEPTHAFIEHARMHGGRVLVHCMAGISRSATIVLAYLMRQQRMTVSESYAHVKRARACISPNLDFMGHLLQLERDLFPAPHAAPSPMSGDSEPEQPQEHAHMHHRHAHHPHRHTDCSSPVVTSMA